MPVKIRATTTPVSTSMSKRMVAATSTAMGRTRSHRPAVWRLLAGGSSGKGSASSCPTGLPSGKRTPVSYASFWNFRMGPKRGMTPVITSSSTSRHSMG